HRAARQKVFRSADLDLVEHDAFLKRHKIRLGIEGPADVFRHFPVERLVLRGENAALHQLLDHFVELHVELFSQLADSDAFRQRNFAKFSRNFDFRLRARCWRSEFLFDVTFIALLITLECTLPSLIDRSWGDTCWTNRRTSSHGSCGGCR